MFDWADPLLIVAGTLTAIGLAGFGWVSFREREPRAARIAIGLALTAIVPIGIAVVAPVGVKVATAAVVVAVIIVGVIWWFWPIGDKQPHGGQPSGRIDERDIMFARARLRPGTPEFESYYAMRPDNRAGDDRTRRLPGLLSTDAELADPTLFAAAKACFGVCESLRTQADGVPADVKHEAAPKTWSRELKELSRYLGATGVGIGKLRSEHIYSHIGRGTGTWGAPVELDHAWALAFTVEMDHRAISHAPNAPVVLESAKQYVALSRIGVELASVIRTMGYPARAHTDGNYRVIAPLVARDAGLGEIGRMGLLMTPNLGPRVRIGVVTTDLPLVADPPGDDSSVLDFCAICRKCAINCPVGAIPDGDREPVGEGIRWKIDDDSCFRYWNVVGTDCATCMRVCPYSHPDNLAHNVVRWAIRHSGGARRVLLRADDLFYGRKPTTKTRIKNSESDRFTDPSRARRPN
jgi:ferredoxin